MKKKINRKPLPKYADGKGVWDTVATAGSMLPDLASFAAMSMPKGLDMQPKTRTAQDGPIQYQKKDKLSMSDLKRNNVQQGVQSTIGMTSSGASIGGAIGGPLGAGIGAGVGLLGGAISSIFGANKRKKQLRRMNEQIDKANRFNYASAQSDLLEQDYYDEFGNNNLPTYSNGKAPKSYAMGKPNAMVDNGETIKQSPDMPIEEVTEGNDNVTDNVPARLTNESAILSDKIINPKTGKPFSEDGKRLSNMEKKATRNAERNTSIISKNTQALNMLNINKQYYDLIQQQEAVKGIKSKGNKFAKGKSNTDSLLAETMPDLSVAPIQVPTTFGNIPMQTPSKAKSKFDISGAITGVGSALGELAPVAYNITKGLGKTDTVSPEELYTPNPYEGTALRKMTGRRYDVRPELEVIQEAEAIQRYNTRQMGTEAGIGRAMNVAGAARSAKAKQAAWSKKQMVDQDYSAQEAQMLSQLGAQRASAQSAASREAYDINARNKAAKSGMLGTGLSQLSQYAQTKKLMKNQKNKDQMMTNIARDYMSAFMPADMLNKYFNK